MKIWLYHCFPSVNFVDKLIGIKDNFLHESCSSIWGDSIQIYFIYLGAIISWLWIFKFGRWTSTKQENQLSLVSYGGRCRSLQGRDLSVAAGALQRGMAVALRRWRRETTRRMKSGARARCWLTEDDFGWRSQLWTSGGWPSAWAQGAAEEGSVPAWRLRTGVDEGVWQHGNLRSTARRSEDVRRR
jgi:hypothetical protein